MLGTDLIQLSDFSAKFSNSELLKKIFVESELKQNKTSESLAGVFAAKEAFFKALGEKKDWLDVWVEKQSTGKPTINSIYLHTDQKAEVSISHSGDYAIATVIITLEV